MKILVIRFLQIGDVVMTSALCSSLKASFNDCQIDYLMHASSAPLFDNHPDIDNVIALSHAERKNPFKYLRKVLELRHNKYDIIIDATSTAKSELVSLFSKSSKFRIGRYKKHRSFGYTHRIPKHELTGNKIEQRLKLLQPLIDNGLPIKLEVQMRLHPFAQERSKMRKLMQDHGVDFNRPIFAFSVSAREKEKRWRQPYMQTLVQHCLDKYHAQIIFFQGMPHEQLIINQLYDSMPSKNDLFTDIPTPSLRSLLPLFANCDLFVGNEGGPRHFAHCVGTPSVSVFSPSADFDEWYVGDNSRHLAVSWLDMPINQTRSIPKFDYGDDTYYELYNSITPDAVIPLIDKVVKQHVKINTASYAWHN